MILELLREQGSVSVGAVEERFGVSPMTARRDLAAEGFLTDPDPLEAEVKRSMIERARTTVLIADAHKFDERGLSVIVGIDAVDIAYLADPPAAGLRALADANVEVHRV
jgi:DeoR/GlpR family transcriptional regulator of sugar metabolism